MHTLVKKVITRLAFIYYPNGKERDQMVGNDIAAEKNCFLVNIHLILIAFWIF